MKHGSMFLPLKGTVEVDETYVGGKPRKENKGSNGGEKPKSKRGRGTDRTPVMPLVGRNGNVVSKPLWEEERRTREEKARRKKELDV